MDLRSGKGPRDWEPGMPSVPGTPAVLRPSRTEAVHPLRGIGVLSVLLGAFFLVFATVMPGSSEPIRPFVLLLPLGALTAGVAGVVARGLGGAVRTVAWCGLTLTIAGGAVFGLQLIRPHAEPVPEPAVAAAGVPVEAATPESLEQAAGTLVFLLKMSGNSCPDALTDNGVGFVLTPAGNIRLPETASLTYLPGDDCALSIHSPGVGTATWTSPSGVVTFVP